MTTERIRKVELTDILRVSMVCKTCGSAFSMPVEAWEPPGRCYSKNCNSVAWADTDKLTGQALHGLALHMKRLRESAAELPFSLQFDLQDDAEG